MNPAAAVDWGREPGHRLAGDERHDALVEEAAPATWTGADTGPLPEAGQSSAADETADRMAHARARRAERRRERANAPVPQRVPQFAHLSIQDVREIRAVVQHELEMAAYWNRVMQSRLAVVRDGQQPKPRVVDLRRALRAARESPLRTAAVLPDAGAPTLLPDLAELWSREMDPDDEDARSALETALVHAEEQLGAYRLQLQSGGDAVTAELIARYREAPGLAIELLG